MELEKRVLLLALYKHPDLSKQEVLTMLANAKLFTLKEGKKLVKELRAQEYLTSSLTPKGIALAKSIEEEFRL